MMVEWRVFLYPLGFLSALAFGARFIVQWIESERVKKSVVPRLFWQLSLAGNVLLIIHSLIQIQYHVCVVQVCNAVISWRNLDLTQSTRPPISFSKVCAILLCSILAISTAFIAQDYWMFHEGGWFRIPIAPWQDPMSRSVPLYWHVIGTMGYFLFSTRFWIQWWYAEKTYLSQLPLSFWWMSLIGALLSILYFLRIHDSVNLVGPLVGMIPYIRNLMLFQKRQNETI